jgi:hypothetical protein
MRRSILLLAAGLAGCQTVSNVSPAGSGNYTVSSEVRGGLSSWSEVKALTVGKAIEYCTAQGKDMQQIDTKTHGARGWTPQEAELTFRCVDTQRS